MRIFVNACTIEAFAILTWGVVNGSIIFSAQYSYFMKAFAEVVGLERGPLSLVSTLEELTGLYSSVILIAVRVLGYRSRSPGFLIF
jgi:hypothetical protein